MAEKYSIMIIVRTLLLYTSSIAVIIVNRIAMHGIKVRWLRLFHYFIQCGCMEEIRLIYSNNLVSLHGFSLQYYMMVLKNDNAN